MDPMESSNQQDIVEESQKLVDSLDKLRVSAGSSSSNFKKKPVIIIVVGMAGSRKTRFMHRLVCHTFQSKRCGYVLNLDPAVISLPFVANIDIRDTVKYKEVMKQYNLGPNGGILTSLNLFATKFDEVISVIEKLADQFDYVLVNTPSQTEIFTCSPSGSIITKAFASNFPTVVTYVVDTPRSTSPIVFMNSLRHACSILYKTRLPLVLAFKKPDVADHKFALEWMEDFEVSQAALETDNSYTSKSANRLSLSLYEYYRNISPVGVSAIPGTGMDNFFTAIEASAEKYIETHKTDLDKRKAEKELLDEEMEKLRKDMENAQEGTVEDKARAGEIIMDVDSKSRAEGRGGEIVTGPSLFSFLPEECISYIVSSITSPREVCAVSMVSKSFDSAAKSDVVWEKFLPSDYSSLFPRSRDLSSKREIYFHICNNPVLIEDGKLSFWLDKASGKNCIMLSAMSCSVSLGEDPRSWQWIQIPEARFENVAELLCVRWFEIRGQTSTRFLSPRTCYTAYIVLKKTLEFYGFENVEIEAEFAVASYAYATKRIRFDWTTNEQRLWLGRTKSKVMKLEEREDGWMEAEVGEFFLNKAGWMDGNEVRMSAVATERFTAKRGLIIQGFELRPTKTRMRYGSLRTLG